ncbi:transposase [Planctomycetota bacterium]
MPRIARAVFAGIPHHITQRGNRREDVFFSDDDRQKYLQWLIEYCEQNAVHILAYCLMTNHVHLVAVPQEQDGLHRVLKPLHMRYAQRMNRQFDWKGHFWQGRFFSSALDEAYMWAAIRYVERNPVRAKIVRKAEKYPWSSAAAHCGLRDDPVLTKKHKWRKMIEHNSTGWSSWLIEGDEDEELAIIRRNINKGLPCGDDNFIKKLGKLVDRILEYRPPHRPKKEKKG